MDLGCLIVLVLLGCPRLVMAVIYFATTWFSQAYETSLWPFLGFLFMPFTTLAYMAAMLNNNHSVSGWWLVLVVVAVLTDLGSNGHGATRKNNSD